MENQEDNKITRDRLNKYIKENIKSHLIIFTAPMGFGKAAAVENYLSCSDIKNSIWLYVEDKKEKYIWNDFCNELSKIKSSLAKKIKKIGLPDKVDKIDNIAEILKSDLKKPFCLIFDGFDMEKSLASDMLYSFIKKLVYEEISNLTIIITTKKHINNDFLELSLNGYCDVINREVLKFNVSEIKEYMVENNIYIDDKQSKKIYDITGGWIFLIKLIKEEYEFAKTQTKFPSTQDYVKRIFFDRRHREYKEIILNLMPLEDFALEQAKYIIGVRHSYNIIDELLDEGIVFFKNCKTNTYSMCPLLKNALQGEFLLSGISEKSIVKKSALWMEMQHDYMRSLKLYVKAESKENVLRILSSMHCTRNEYELKVLTDVFDFLGEDKFIHRRLYINYILLYSLIIDRQKGRDKYYKAEKHYLTDEKMDKDNKFLALLSFVGCFMQFNDIEKMLPKIKYTFDCLKEQTIDLNELKIEFLFGVYSLIFVFYRSPGTLKQILMMSKECINFYSLSTAGHDVGTDFLLDADYSLLIGDYGNVENLVIKAIFKSKLAKNYEIMISAYFILLRLYMLTKKKTDCDKIINEVLMIKEKNIINESTADIILGYYYSCMGDKENVPFWIRKSDIDKCKLLKRLRNISYVVMGIYMAFEKKYLELEVFAIMMRDEYQKTEHYALGVIYAYIFLAVAKLGNGNKDEAVEFLDRAINLSEFDGIVEPFIELSSHILPLLEVLSKNNQFAKNILGNCKASKNILEEKKREEYKFTQREIQVINLMLEGHKQVDIAKKLYVSLPTVKKHTQNIYKKLGISSKGEAINILKNDYKNKKLY